MNPIIAIIGGTGIHYEEIFTSIEEQHINTIYGEVYLKTADYDGKNIIFLERHGKGHRLSPHEVNYRANIQALKEVGVERIIATAAVGAINPSYKVGSFVLIDDFIDFTKSRKSTYFEDANDGIVHIDMSEPYCKALREYILRACNNRDYDIYDKGTYICTEGPRFETKAEIKAFSFMGADVVGMTSVPEVVLAKEKNMCYASIGLVTNYAAGVSNSVLTHKEVVDNMDQMSNKLKDLLLDTINMLHSDRNCSCKYSTLELGSLK